MGKPSKSRKACTCGRSLRKQGKHFIHCKAIKTVSDFSQISPHPWVPGSPGRKEHRGQHPHVPPRLLPICMAASRPFYTQRMARSHWVYVSIPGGSVDTPSGLFHWRHLLSLCTVHTPARPLVAPTSSMQHLWPGLIGMDAKVPSSEQPYQGDVQVP